MHEALLRMADVDGDMIAAAHLIPIAEKLGLVRLIDRTVVQLTIATLLAYPEARLSLQRLGHHRHRSALVRPADRDPDRTSRRDADG